MGQVGHDETDKPDGADKLIRLIFGFNRLPNQRVRKKKKKAVPNNVQSAIASKSWQLRLHGPLLPTKKEKSMYSVRLGYDKAIKRINSLIKGGHHAESLVTTVFTAEKTLRRTLRFLIVSCGFNTEIAEKQIKKLKGIDAIKNNWEYYSPEHKKLTEVVNQNDWRILREAAEIRNKLVHGEKAFDKATCKKMTKELLQALENIKTSLENEYGYSGWKSLKKREKSILHTKSLIKKK